MPISHFLIRIPLSVHQGRPISANKNRHYELLPILLAMCAPRHFKDPFQPCGEYYSEPTEPEERARETRVGRIKPLEVTNTHKSAMQPQERPQEIKLTQEAKRAPSRSKSDPKVNRQAPKQTVNIPAAAREDPQKAPGEAQQEKP